MICTQYPIQIPESDAKPPRIWWCPTGPLAFLPIHAAGIYKEGHQKKRRLRIWLYITVYKCQGLRQKCSYNTIEYQLKPDWAGKYL